MKGIGLVFTGGGGKGAYQIGVWKYLHEQGIDRYVRSVSGTSVGALNAALFVGGYYKQSERIWESIQRNQVLTPKNITDMLKTYALFSLPDSMPGAITEMIKSYAKVASPITMPSVILNQAYLDVVLNQSCIFSRSGIIKLIQEGVNFSRIRKSRIPCFVTCLNIPFMTVKRFQLNNYDNATGIKILLASSAIPYIFKPEEIKGRFYVDGGTPRLGDNVPIQPVYDTGVETIIVIHLDQDKSVDKTKYPNSRIIEIVPRNDLGGITDGMLDFKSENAVWRMGLGYDDANYYLKGLNYKKSKNHIILNKTEKAGTANLSDRSYQRTGLKYTASYIREEKTMNCQEALALIENMSETYSVNTMRCKELSDEMQSFQVNVVVVGGFSAGKSALLNKLMERDVLKEGQRPETAIASELVYDTEEYVEAFSEDRVERYQLDGASDLDAERYDYLRWHLSNDVLAGLHGYTLVDMPGFNSGIQAHNKAILRYTDKASAYLLVIDAEEGGIKQSLADFMREIRSYEHNVAIVVTKCDLKTPENAHQITANITDSAELQFGEQVSVVSTSVKDPDCPKKLDGLIRRFNQDELFRQRFVPLIRVVGESLINTLELKKKGEKLNASELEDEITKREKAKKDLERSFAQKRQKIAEQFGNQAVDSVIREAEEALLDEIPSLVSSLRAGNQAFSSRVNAILRPVLVNAVRDYTNQSYEQFAFILSQPNVSTDEMTYEETIEQRLKIYHIITSGLAITTSVVAPWLEVLIILLPDIVRFFMGAGGRSSQDDLEDRVRSEIIPQIVSGLQPKIEESLREMADEVLRELEENAQERMDEELRVLENLKTQLQEKKDEHSRKMDTIDADMSTLREALASL